MNPIDQLKSICKELKLAGENDLADEALCALAALTDTITPRADLSYTYIMRKLRKTNKDKIPTFQKTFKQAFEDSLDEELDNPEEIALIKAMKAIEFTDE